MPPHSLLKLRHLNRGSWLAQADDVRSRRILGDAPLAVLRDWENGLFDWHATPRPVMDATQEDLAGRDDYWWMQPRHEAWRAALTDGALVWVRQATGAGPEATGGVGRSKGVWRIADVDIGPDRMFLRLQDRIGDVKT